MLLWNLMRVLAFCDPHPKTLHCHSSGLSMGTLDSNRVTNCPTLQVHWYSVTEDALERKEKKVQDRTGKKGEKDRKEGEKEINQLFIQPTLTFPSQSQDLPPLWPNISQCHTRNFTCRHCQPLGGKCSSSQVFAGAVFHSFSVIRSFPSISLPGFLPVGLSPSHASKFPLMWTGALL